MHGVTMKFITVGFTGLLYLSEDRLRSLPDVDFFSPLVTTHTWAYPLARGIPTIFGNNAHPLRSDWVCGVLDRLQFAAICSLLTTTWCFIQTLQMFLRYGKMCISAMKISRQQ